MKPWRIVESSVLLERKWLAVRQERIELPHGGEIDEFHVIVAPDWTGILALTETGEVVLVEQYRHGAGRVSRELPAGVIDRGESPLDAAVRELREETGFEAKDFAPLLTVQTEPSRHTNRAHFFFASGARRVASQNLDASEHIHVVLVDPRTLVAAIESGAIHHGVHVAAILLAGRRGLIDLG
ncbi:MAG: NUDIX hydrolase [Polyangiaceae bacterium]